MDTIVVSSEVLASLLGKSATELSTALKVGEGEAKELLPQTEIDEFVKSSFAEKFKGLETRKKNEGKGYGQKQTYEEIEAYLSEKGFENGNWKTRIDEALSATGNQPDAIDENSPIFIKALEEKLKPIKEELQQEREAHVNTKAEFSTKETVKSITDKVNAYIDDPANKFVLPENKDRAARMRQLIVDDALNKAKISLSDDGIILKDKEKDTILEDANYSPVKWDDYVGGIAKVYLDVNVADPKATPASGVTTPTTSTVTIPAFTNAEQGHEFLNTILTDPKYSKEDIDSVTKQISELKE